MRGLVIRSMAQGKSEMEGRRNKDLITLHRLGEILTDSMP